MAKKEKSVLSQIVAVNLNINIWSAKTKLRPEDFNHADLPPGNLASLGSKKVCDPKELRIFGTLKSRAVSLLDKHGVKFLGGWAVPEKLTSEISDGLDVIAKEFEEAKKQFLKKYDQSVQDWIKQNHGWEQIIANSTVSKNYVSSKIGFNWQMFTVSHAMEPRREEKSGLCSAIDILPETLLSDIEKMARDAFNKSYLAKSEVTRKALAPLKNIKQKLIDLSFVDPRAIQVATLIQMAVDRIPLRGAISGDMLVMLNSLLMLIMDRAVLNACTRNLLEAHLTHDEVLDSFIQTENKKQKVEVKAPKFVQDEAVVIEPTPEQEEVPTIQLDSMGLW